MDTVHPTITGIATIGIEVTDQDRSLRFYTEQPGMQKQLDVPLPQFGAAGSLWLRRLRQQQSPPCQRAKALPLRVETGIRLARPDAAAAHRQLHEEGVDVGELLHWQGVSPMFAFRDPDGNGLETTQETQS